MGGKACLMGYLQMYLLGHISACQPSQHTHTPPRLAAHMIAIEIHHFPVILIQ